MRFSPLFDKEGKGRFFDGMKWTNAANFRDRTLVILIISHFGSESFRVQTRNLSLGALSDRL